MWLSENDQPGLGFLEEVRLDPFAGREQPAKETILWVPSRPEHILEDGCS